MSGRRLYLKTENGHSPIEVAEIFPACYDFFSGVVLPESELLEADMTKKTFPDEDRLKDLVKTAFREVLDERRDLQCEVVEEALEDVGLIRPACADGTADRAITEGQLSNLVPRDKVFELFRSEA